MPVEISQNLGNYIGEHPSTRVTKPPGGASSFSLGWGGTGPVDDGRRSTGRRGGRTSTPPPPAVREGGATPRSARGSLTARPAYQSSAVSPTESEDGYGRRQRRHGDFSSVTTSSAWQDEEVRSQAAWGSNSRQAHRRRPPGTPSEAWEQRSSTEQSSRSGWDRRSRLESEPSMCPPSALSSNFEADADYCEARLNEGLLGRTSHHRSTPNMGHVRSERRSQAWEDSSSAVQARTPRRSSGYATPAKSRPEERTPRAGACTPARSSRTREERCETPSTVPRRSGNSTPPPRRAMVRSVADEYSAVYPDSTMSGSQAGYSERPYDNDFDNTPIRGGGGPKVTHGQRPRPSSNNFAHGCNQNCGNMITDVPTTRVVAPPGGVSSIHFGDMPEQKTPRSATPAGRRTPPGGGSSIMLGSEANDFDSASLRTLKKKMLAVKASQQSESGVDEGASHGLDRSKPEVEGSRPRVWRPAVQPRAPPGGEPSYEKEASRSSGKKRCPDAGGAGANRDHNAIHALRYYQDVDGRLGTKQVQRQRSAPDKRACDSHRYYLEAEGQAECMPGKVKVSKADHRSMLSWTASSRGDVPRKGGAGNSSTSTYAQSASATSLPSEEPSECDSLPLGAEWCNHDSAR